MKKSALTAGLVAAGLLGCFSGASVASCERCGATVTRLVPRDESGDSIVISSAALSSDGRLLVASGGVGKYFLCPPAGKSCVDTGLPTIRPMIPTGIAFHSPDSLVLWSRFAVYSASIGPEVGMRTISDSLFMQQPRYLFPIGLIDAPSSARNRDPTQVPPTGAAQPIVRYSLSTEAPEEVWRVRWWEPRWTLLAGTFNRVIVAGVADDSVLVVRAWDGEAFWLVPGVAGPNRRLPELHVASAWHVWQERESRTVVAEVLFKADDAIYAGDGLLAVIEDVSAQPISANPFSARRHVQQLEQQLKLKRSGSGAWVTEQVIQLGSGRWRFLHSSRPGVLLLFRGALPDGTPATLVRVELAAHQESPRPLPSRS